MSNVKSLFPDMPSIADEYSSAEVMAQNLEGLAAALRNGELNIKHGSFIYLAHDLTVNMVLVGDTTKHQMVSLTTIAQALAMRDVFED